MPDDICDLSPVEICRCGSVAIEEMNQDWSPDGLHIFVQFQCGECENLWQIRYTMSELIQL